LLEGQVEELLRERKGLLKIISHDIRSPFNKIHALIQLMKMSEDQLNEDQIEYLNNMHVTVMSGLELVRNMHDIKMIDEGLEISKEETDLNAIVKKAVQNFAELAELKKLKIYFDSSCKDAKLLVDSYYLQRAIENVISNAIKYSFEDKPINLNLEKDDNIYSLSITDFGQGIKPEEVDLLFKKYSKLSSRATKGEGSSGLGLYLAKYFLEQMNGEIFYHNQDKGMTTFVIQFPV